MPAAIYNKGSAQLATVHDDLSFFEGVIRPMSALPRIPIIEPFFGGSLPSNSTKIGGTGALLRDIPAPLHALARVRDLRVVYSLSNGIDSIDGDEIIPRLAQISTGDPVTKVRELLAPEVDGDPWGGWEAYDFASSDDGTDDSSVEFSMRLDPLGRYDAATGQWFGIFDLFVDGFIRVDGDLTLEIRAARQENAFGLSDSSPIVLTILGVDLPLLADVNEGVAADLTGHITITAHSWLDWE